ncbi:acyltransferase family protein [Venenivibrio stagnispumantis]|uniref:Peptidoglycan-N-acetylmuramate O-acetyltransferase n=1 Tax=Venenivibrio stagnispumantis TaxID=407998 RepID=A0AA46ADD3_9AQUI|nr:acyltransferase family protein [Venenivibrio stagnispumantis]MCW4572395.1 acetyltransferase [Venenivibrio stagnispumantis]SMP03872.1 peptidoglycan-N-acetylmuramate O-acetyltransferase [Venenivibrio stagnispumantis]
MEKIRDRLDGLKGLLIIAVIIYHFLFVYYPTNIDFFKGGFLAVDLFFVLSGFLITKSMFRRYEQNEGEIGKTFIDLIYSRFIRLIPPFVFVLMIITGFVYFTKNDLFDTFAEEGIFSSLFLYNWWLIFRDIPYFQQYTTPIFLLNFWYLSVLFQLYIFWFLSFLFLRRFFSEKVIIYFLISLITLSLLENYIIGNVYQLTDRAYFGTDTRAFSFFIGALFYILKDKDYLSFLNHFLFKFLPVISLVLLITIFFEISSFNDYLYPFWFLVVDLIGLIILYGIFNFDFMKILSIFAIIGRRSYSLYLSHYPVFVLMQIILKEESILFAILTTIAITELSYNLIERFDLNNFPVYRIINAISFALSIGFIFGYINDYSKKQNIVSSKEENIVSISDTDIKEEVKEEISKIVKQDIQNSENKPTNQEKISKDENLEIDNQEYSEKIYMIGDSVMLGASNMLKKIFPNAYIDAKVGRQLKEVDKIIESNIDKIQSSQIVVIGLGTNGYFRKEDLEKIISKIGEDKKIYLLTVKVNKPWQNEVNKNIYQVAEEKPNVKVIDWYNIAKDKEDIFAEDKTHLNVRGIKLYSILIKKNINQEEEKYSDR